ncbi:hypothetical protein, partial [Teichococcus cervicalis]
PAPPGFAPGAARQAHEARWTEAAYATLHELLATLPPAWRAALKRACFAALREAPAEEPAEDVIRRTFAARMAATEGGAA